MTPGDKQTGGYYTYGQKWRESSYEGVMWITDYKTELDASDLDY